MSCADHETTSLSSTPASGAEGPAAAPPLPRPGWRLEAGALFAGRYLVEAPLGRGGFGQVYRARDERLGRTVALKLLLHDRAPAGPQEALFLQEARSLARLDHPNVVSIYDAGIADGTAWMSLRLVEGLDLASILAKERRLEPARAAALLGQALAALDHAHRKGIVHRDIKPANVLVERRDGAEHLWLTDFGIAKLITGRTTEHEPSIAGTPSYMSPEQISGRRVDARSDLFSLGAVAFELLTGSRAFRGSGFAELVYNIVHDEPERLGELEALAGPGLAELVRRLLAKSPEDRHASARDAAMALEAALAANRAPEHKTLPERLRRWLRRPAAAWDGRRVLVVEGIEKGYRFRQKILRGLHLQVPTGATYALLGRNSAGKTTLIRTFLGIYRPDAGRVRIFGRDPYREGPAVLARTGYVPETLAVYEWMRVRELLDFLRHFYPRTWDRAYCYRLLERFELPLESRIRDLSRGMQTKVSLVAALGHRPELLVLDDPTLGLDAVVLQELVETIAEASRREGTTVLISSHNLDEVEKIATHAGFLEGGRMLLSETLPELKRRMCEVRLTFRDDAPALGTIEKYRTLQAAGRRVTGVIFDTDSSAFEQLRSLGPETFETRPLSLKEIFVHLLRTAAPGQSAP
jgi:ABC-type multidrug transport system ATPase subunit